MKILKHRKGQGLSLNTIVIAMLVMIVLLVLILVFTGRISIFTELIGEQGSSCLGRGGKWCDSEACSKEKFTVDKDDQGPGSSDVCCPISYFSAKNPCRE